MVCEIMWTRIHADTLELEKSAPSVSHDSSEWMVDGAHPLTGESTRN